MEGKEANEKMIDKEKLKGELKGILLECNESNWDGYDAEPITQKVVDDAIELLKLLPDDLVIPDAVPSPDGFIDFEWDDGMDRFSIGNDDGLAFFAGKIGELDIRGSFPLSIARYFRIIEDILKSFFEAKENENEI